MEPPACVKALSSFLTPQQTADLTSLLVERKQKLDNIVKLLLPASIVIFLVITTAAIVADIKNSDVVKIVTATDRR